MLLSQFSSGFAKFSAKKNWLFFSKTNVMIDFWKSIFGRKREIFQRKYFKILLSPAPGAYILYIFSAEIFTLKIMGKMGIFRRKS
jgi:hypothetical protein